MKTRTHAFGTWLLERFSFGRNRDSMIGDINEQYHLGRSWLWYWRQLLVAIMVGLVFAVFERRQPTMKRMAVWICSLAATFALGYWTASSPWIIQEDPAEVIELVRQARMKRGLILTRAGTIIDHPYGTRYFLQGELDSARANDLKASTPETRRRIRDLEEKLEQIRRRLDGGQR